MIPLDWQEIRAPHLGVHSPLPPLTDMANAQARCPQGIRAHLRVLRAEAHARATAQARTAPGLWKLPKP